MTKLNIVEDDIARILSKHMYEGAISLAALQTELVAYVNRLYMKGYSDGVHSDMKDSKFYEGN